MGGQGEPTYPAEPRPQTTDQVSSTIYVRALINPIKCALFKGTANSFDYM